MAPPTSSSMPATSRSAPLWVTAPHVRQATKRPLPTAYARGGVPINGTPLPSLARAQPLHLATAATAQWHQQAPLHVVAITVDHWVSQARLASNSDEQVMPCYWCGYERTYEWICTEVLRPSQTLCLKLLAELAQVCLCILQQRYSPA